MQEQACGALRNLAVDSDNQLQIAGEGGLDDVCVSVGGGGMGRSQSVDIIVCLNDGQRGERCGSVPNLLLHST